MKRIAFFCIPAHGHTNPMLPVAAELVRRGCAVRFYSFREFEEKILLSGAEFVSCDSFIKDFSLKDDVGMRNISRMEMVIQDLCITQLMNDFLDKEFTSFCPDVVFADSVCYWGILAARKYRVPLVLSSSTFVFNEQSSVYKKTSLGEKTERLMHLPRISSELKKLQELGYPEISSLSLIEGSENTDTVVYASKKFQPCAESFNGHYAFVGPSLLYDLPPYKEKTRPLVYVSLGTVINDRPVFYQNCISAMENEDVDMLISCGNKLDRDLLGIVPDNIRVKPYVNQLDVLSRADVFITHCGMNSVTEGLCMAAPMILYPQTIKEKAAAMRVKELGAGLFLEDDSASGIRKAVRQILADKKYAEAAAAASADFRSCPGPAGAADFIEAAPHEI